MSPDTEQFEPRGTSLQEPAGAPADPSAGNNDLRGSHIVELLQNHHFKRARAALQAHLVGQETSEQLWLRSWSEHAWGNLAIARDLAEKAVALDHSSARFALRLAETYIDIARQQDTGVLLKLRLANQFREQIGRTLELEPENVGALRCLLQFYLGAPAAAGGSKEKARQIAARLAAASPPEGFLASAKIAAAAGDTDAALNAYRNAAAAKPANPEAILTLARQLLKAELYPEAELNASAALERNPGNVAAYEVLAELYSIAERWDVLDDLLERLASDVDDNLSPHFYVGIVCSQRDHTLLRARVALERYLEKPPEPNYPSFATTHWRLGQIAQRMGDSAFARRSFEVSVECNPKSPAKADLAKLTHCS